MTNELYSANFGVACHYEGDNTIRPGAKCYVTWTNPGNANQCMEVQTESPGGREIIKVVNSKKLSTFRAVRLPEHVRNRDGFRFQPCTKAVAREIAEEFNRRFPGGSETSVMNRPKPTLGLIPERLWLEERIEQLRDAMQRYEESTGPMPAHWRIELAGHLARLQEMNCNQQSDNPVKIPSDSTITFVTAMCCLICGTALFWWSDGLPEISELATNIRIIAAAGIMFGLGSMLIWLNGTE